MGLHAASTTIQDVLAAMSARFLMPQTTRAFVMTCELLRPVQYTVFLTDPVLQRQECLRTLPDWRLQVRRRQMHILARQKILAC